MNDEQKRKTLNTAAAVLSYKNRSSTALYERLLEKEIDEELSAFAVARLIELGLLNDREYAMSKIASAKSKGYGVYRIKQELRKCKLDEQLIEELLADIEIDCDKIDRFILTKLKGSVDRADIKRVSDALVRRGHSYDAISEAISRYLDNINQTE